MTVEWDGDTFVDGVCATEEGGLNRVDTVHREHGDCVDEEFAETTEQVLL